MRVLPLFVAAVFVAGCGSTQPSRFYVLKPVEPSAETTSQLALALAPLELPSILDRPQIVTRLGPHERGIAEFARWAEPLDENATEVLASNLAAELGAERVFVLPDQGSRQLDYRLVVSVLRFDATPEGDAVLEAHWRLVAGDGDGAPLVTGRPTLAAPVGSGDYRDIAAAMSRNLAELGAEIAEAVRQVERSGGAQTRAGGVPDGAKRAETAPRGAVARDEPASAPPVDIVSEIRAAAGDVRPLVASTAARAFLDATRSLPSVAPRVVWRDRERGLAFSDAEYEALAPAEREELTRHEYDERFYYYTGYGTPLIYARPLDLVARAGLDDFAGRRVLDFGYGAVGHLRMLASLGAHVVGTEVQPVFRALYSAPEDQGVVSTRAGDAGHLALLHGFFPADEQVAAAVGEDYDLIMSKNVLKRGYVHPEREVDARMTVQLGVDDETFVREVYRRLAPGGFFLIYNLSPAQNPPDEPYIPWADGRCPFDRNLVERVGFDVLAYDTEDNEAAYDLWFALGLDGGQTREELSRSLFAHYTLLRRPPGA